MKRYITALVFILQVGLLMRPDAASAQKPIRAGTTSANFLEIGYGPAANSMGDSYVSLAGDISSAYWNPAGLAAMKQNEAIFSYQPWLVDTQASFAAAGLILPAWGTLALSLTSLNYGEMDVTSLAMQEGTGETFSAGDMAIGLSFARQIATWFSAGATAKYIRSSIWHTHASAMAFDLGVIIQTQFFSPPGNGEHGLNIGMSIANYGSRMRYDGMDLLNPIDISPDEAGNYRDTPGQFKVQEWELPLIFRLGISVHPVYGSTHQVTLSADALHPNNNGESLNLGAQYAAVFPAFGKIFLRAGYKGLFMEDSQYGLSLGFGATMMLMGNKGLKVEYAFRDTGLLGKTYCYSLAVLF
jgi:hypothetical protein